jgi:hypothetical protein
MNTTEDGLQGGTSERELRNKLKDANQRLRKLQEHIANKNARIERQQRDLQQANDRAASAERQAARLHMSLSRAGGDGVSSALSETGTPVFFMVGRGRLGTTWLMNTLNAHHEILCKGEGRFFDRKFRRDDYKDLEAQNVPVTSLHNAIKESEYLRLWIERRPVWSRGRSVEEHLDNLTRMATDYFLAEQLSRSGKRIVGDKTPFARAETMKELSEFPEDEYLFRSAETLEEIGRLYPDAKVIHVIRDGRDVAVSTMHFIWNLAKSEGGLYPLEAEELEIRDRYRGAPSAFTGSLFADNRLASLARGWGIEVRRAVESGPALLGNRYTEVRYEDLLADPQGEVAALLEFLGADADEPAVRECLEATSFERLSSKGKGEEDSSSRHHRKGVAGDWKNVFTEEDKQIFKEQAGDLLVDLGYEEDEEW